MPLPPSALDRFRPVVQEVVDQLLDRVAGRPVFDIARDLAQPLPAVVIARMFDIPAGDRDQFQAWADAAATFFGGTIGDPAASARAANAGALRLEGYFRTLLAARREYPGDDLMSLLIRGQDEGQGFIGVSSATVRHGRPFVCKQSLSNSTPIPSGAAYADRSRRTRDNTDR
jgi:cytochrome P450